MELTASTDSNGENGASGSHIDSMDASGHIIDSSQHVRPGRSGEDAIVELSFAMEGGTHIRPTRRPLFPPSWASFRPTTALAEQKRRRDEAVARYKEKQHQMIIKSRKLMNAFKMSDECSMTPCTPANTMDIGEAYEGAGESSNMKEDAQVERHFSHSLMMPEFLNDVPVDFAENWICSPFPNGVRCLLIARGGTTVARDVEGTRLDEFQSQLPGGSGFTYSDSSQGWTVLDCIQSDSREQELHSSPRRFVYFVLDMLAWNGRFYYNSTAEARFWMKNSWIPEKGGLDTVNKANRTDRNDRLIIPLPTYEANISGLRSATTSPTSLSINMEGIIALPSDNEYQDELSDSEQEFDSRREPPPTTVLHTHHLDYNIEGVMFYAKEMDYIGEQTPIMCLLPLTYAQRLLEERSLRGDP